MRKVIDRKAFSRRLNNIMVDCEMSQTQLAEYCGMEPGQINEYVHVKHLPGLDALVTIARELGCTIDYLLLGRGDGIMEWRWRGSSGYSISGYSIIENNKTKNKEDNGMKLSNLMNAIDKAKKVYAFNDDETSIVIARTFVDGDYVVDFKTKNDDGADINVSINVRERKA